MKKRILPFILTLTLTNLTACNKIKEIIGYQSNDNNDSKKIVIKSKKEINNKRVALLIANEDYKNQTKLNNPVNDLKLIKEKLTNLNYQVRTLENATKKEMFRAIKKFGTNAKNADSAIFYYSGHGMINEDRKNFLIPVNADISQKADIESDGVDAYKIIEALKQAKPRLSLILFDACRNNPLADTKGVGGANRFANLAYHLDKQFLISYATREGEVAYDGRGKKNSPYALALATQFDLATEKPLSEIFNEVKKDVYSRTQGKQMPTKVDDIFLETMLFSNKEDKKKRKKKQQVNEANKNLLLDMTMESLKIPMEVIQSSDQVSAEEKVCVSKIDLNSQRGIIKEAIETAFTSEEIKQLNDFYATPEMQKVNNYGREQILIQMGLPLKETAEKPSKEEMQVVTEFSQTEMGQKYAQFNLSEDANASNEKVNTFIKEELDKCGLGEEPAKE